MSRHMTTPTRGCRPDGSRVAIPALDADADIFVWDKAGQLLTNVTASDEFDSYALWTADGRHLIVAPTRSTPRTRACICGDQTGPEPRNP